ncbi:hypothetical protein GCM10008955_09360 [Deinococcus malanensis]|uniref:Uncharacterized protein n=1 Tax=Deinococcus malanensis TaxID=1706855 RepID=A0ABQ2ENF2_9DEIO|nr:hypothetical protein GCM10008955_09360 [Deinococcus malanensis]
MVRGALCKKALAALSHLRPPECPTQPLLCRNGTLVPLSWVEALAYARTAGDDRSLGSPSKLLAPGA